MNRIAWHLAWLMWCVAFSIILYVVARSEPYLQAQGGLSFPARLHDFEGEYWSKGRFSTSDLALQHGPSYGAKVGYFFNRLPWIGVDLDYLHASPGDTAQSYWLTTPHGHHGTTTGALEPTISVKVDSASLNTALRYPGAFWQPYVAAGPALFWGNYGGDPTNTGFGLNLETGLRVVVWKGLFVSGSYRYQQAHLTFRESTGPGGSINGFTTFYQSQFALAGLGWAF